MPRAAEARAWWADVEEVRDRIERRRARESEARVRGTAHSGASAPGGNRAVPAPSVRRGVREVRPGRHLMVVPNGLPVEGSTSAAAAHGSLAGRSRPRRRLPHGVGARPDRVAAWAVVLGFALVLAAILSAHG